MRVTYGRTVRDKVDEEIARAGETGQEIAYIELDPKEFIAFMGQAFPAYVRDRETGYIYYGGTEIRKCESS